MRIVHLTLFHQRPEMSAVWLEHMRGRQVAACVTEGDVANIELLTQHEVPFIEWPNKPLGAKCNAGLKFALTFDPDAVMILPSDDFPSQEWEAVVDTYLRAGHDYILPARVAMHEPWTGRSCVLDQTRGLNGVGSGRVFSRALLDDVGPLWTPEKPRGLDVNSHKHILDAGYHAEFVHTDKIPLVDVKSSKNIWSYDQWSARARHVTEEEALWMIRPALRKRLRRMSK